MEQVLVLCARCGEWTDVPKKWLELQDPSLIQRYICDVCMDVEEEDRVRLELEIEEEQRGLRVP